MRRTGIARPLSARVVQKKKTTPKRGRKLEPEGGIAAIGSGGLYALSAAKALADYESDPEKLARRAMAIAAEVCVFTNDRLTVETV